MVQDGWVKGGAGQVCDKWCRAGGWQVVQGRCVTIGAGQVCDNWCRAGGWQLGGTGLVGQWSQVVD